MFKFNIQLYASKKGFTLVELLATITIILAILFILIPKVLEVIHQQKQKAYAEQIDRIEKVVDLYVTENAGELGDLSLGLTISLEDLSNAGYINLPVENPLTGENMDEANTTITITETGDNVYSYSVLEVEGTQYGAEIESFYNRLYASWTAPGPVINTDNDDDYYDGNTRYAWSIVYTDNEPISYTFLNDIDLGSNNSSIYDDTNTYNLQTISSTNRWLSVIFQACNGTNNVYVGDFHLIFNDNVTYTLEEAVEHGYIEPLVITAGSYLNTNYLWTGMYNLVNGGNTDTIDYAKGYVVFKVKATPVKGLSFYSNVNFNGFVSDGFQVREYGTDFDLSIIPFE